MDIDAESRARTHLANERTYLAWFRTGITLVALGLAAAQFLAPGTAPGDALVRGLSLMVIGTGAFVMVVGAYRYREGRRRIDAASFRPAASSIVIASAAGIGIALLGAALILLVPSA
jgi:putative membrane protein